jgi:hypothetical protein
VHDTQLTSSRLNDQDPVTHLLWTSVKSPTKTMAYDKCSFGEELHDEKTDVGNLCISELIDSELPLLSAAFGEISNLRFTTFITVQEIGRSKEQELKSLGVKVWARRREGGYGLVACCNFLSWNLLDGCSCRYGDRAPDPFKNIKKQL